MDTPEREASSLAHHFNTRDTAPMGGKETQVVLSLGDRAGTEVPTGWAPNMMAALSKAEAYISKHLPGRHL